MASKTVKARRHAGASSLDLTIPAAVVAHHKIAPGDVFTFEVAHAGSHLVLRYARVHARHA